MKRVLPILGFLLFSYYLFAQDATVVDRNKTASKAIIELNPWINSANGIYYYEEFTDPTKLEKTVATKNVGIGLTIPMYKLHAAGDIFADGGWLRASGSKGLYFQSYGGGLYMTDATWIRTYGNKSFYHNTGIMRTDGTFQVGSSGDRFIVNTTGNVGVGTISPDFKLQVEHNVAGDGGWTSGINIKSINATTGEAAISFNNIATSANHWIMGLNQSNKFKIAYGSSYYDSYSKFTIDTDGKIGIGTSTPTKKLDVSGDINYTGNLYKNGQLVDLSGGSSPWINTGTKIYYPVGDVGIGMTPFDGAKLQIKQGWGTWIRFSSISNSGYWAFCNGEEQETFHIYYRHPDGSIIYPLRLKTDGSIQTMELLVTELKAGNIFSKELTLEIENVADYVFDKEYKLNSIEEVEDFVKINKHLPGMPSADVLEEQGVNVAEMSNLLLQKVEELTLYIIQLENRISEIENK